MRYIEHGKGFDNEPRAFVFSIYLNDVEDGGETEFLHFSKNNLKTKDLISQKEFLENMGIMERAKILAKKMKFTEQSDLYLRIKRLLSPRYMGELFKVILAYKFDKDNFAGFK